MQGSRVLTTALLAVLSAAFVARPTSAAPKETGNLKFAVALEPERVAPGGEGVLVVTGTIRKGLHVYADGRFKVTPLAAEGVTYGKHETTKPTPYKDPEFPEDEASDVWFDKVVLRIPFQVAADAKLPRTVGVTLKWSACDEAQCYPPEESRPLTAEVSAPEPKKGGDAEPAPAPLAAPEEGAGPPAAVPAATAAAPRGFDVRTTAPHEEVVLTVRATEREFVVTFDPAPGHHLYAPGHEGGEHPVEVRGLPAPGVTWGRLVTPLVESTELRSTYEVRLPYVADGSPPDVLEVTVSWQACLDTGTCRPPRAPQRFALRPTADPVQLAAVAAPTERTPVPAGVEAAAASGAPGPGAVAPVAGVPPPPVAGSAPSTGLLFPVVGKRGGDLEGDVSGQWTRKGFFVFLLGFFLTGMALAMTPCVLPIIPITVSIIGGGRADLSRGRLTFLLSCYVAGLALAFGTMGVAAALTGESLSAAFQSPVAIWVIAGLFVLLSLGMFGIFELQPPAFLQRLQGGAKGGNPLGAFGFGAISAVLASPCTGPVIAGALIFTAQAGNTLTGFLVFFTIGLGMGAVFFAAGSLNLLMRPGPWMVWVRYVFGILMVAGALYYLASSGKVSGTAIFALGFALAALIGVAVGRHLATKEGETVTAAAVRATKVAVLLALATGTVAFLTRQPETEALRWTNVTSREQLVAEVAKARARGQATVVDVWATWCNYCRQYDRVIERDARLLAEFEKLHRVRMDLSHEERPWEEGLREGLGIPGNTQPFMVFIDREGRIRGPLDVVKWMGEQSTQGLRDRVQAVYEPPTGEAASAGGS